MIRIFIVSDIRLYRDGLAQILARHSGLAVIGVAADETEAVGRLRSLRADVVLVDASVPGGLAIIRALVAAMPKRNVVALTVRQRERDMIACVEAGISGFVTRESSIVELVETIRSAMRGEALCSPRTVAMLMRRISTVAPLQVPRGRARLTNREREIAELVDSGLSNKEIALRLHIQLSTVKNHMHNILAKAQVHHRSEVAAKLPG